MNQRPAGVSILAALVIIEALLGILGGLITILTLGFFTGILIIAGILLLLLSLVQLAVGVGLWRLRRWAWTVGVVVTGLSLLGDIIGLAGGATTFPAIVSLILNGVILWYLFRQDVKAAFR